jgi:GxxExxY protein
MSREEREKLSKRIIGACIQVHKRLGPGLLESVYEACVMDEFPLHGIHARSQVDLPIIYRGRKLDKKFKVDVLVEDEIILELKSVEVVLPIHEEQLLTYLKLADRRLGLLINFNVVLLKDGIRRKINGYD